MQSNLLWTVLGAEGAQLVSVRVTFWQGGGAMWTHPLIATIPLICLCFNSENTAKRHVSSFDIQVVQQAQVISAFSGKDFQASFYRALKNARCQD